MRRIELVLIPSSSGLSVFHGCREVTLPLTVLIPSSSGLSVFPTGEPTVIISAES